jgi:transformation/transcription domain-associated protein
MLADMIHHVRSDLPSTQLARVVTIYSAMVHNLALTGGIQTMCAKLLVTLTESIIAKHGSGIDAAVLLYDLLQSDVDKLTALHAMHTELSSIRRAKDQPITVEDSPYIAIERSKPIFGAAFVSEPVEDVLRGTSAHLITPIVG